MTNGQNKRMEPITKDVTLIVTDKSWYLSVKVQGPDTRYGQKEFRIQDIEMDQYIEAYKKNFHRYLELKSSNTTITQEIGELNMTIRFGLYEGVCLFLHYSPVKTKKDLDKIIDLLRAAQAKAKEMIEDDI